MRNGPLDIAGDPGEQRAIFERMLTARPLADDVTATPGSLGGVPVLTIEAGETRTGTVLLWLHGGWYAMGSPRTSAGLSSEVARRTGARVVSVDYRLAPEHPYPAALWAWPCPAMTRSRGSRCLLRGHGRLRELLFPGMRGSWRRSRQRGHGPGRECAVNGARVPELASYDVVLVNISGG